MRETGWVGTYRAEPSEAWRFTFDRRESEDLLLGHRQCMGSPSMVEGRLDEFLLGLARHVGAAVAVNHPSHGSHYGADRRSAANFVCVSRYSWIDLMAPDPSPTEDATLLVERERTSPTAKTPGTEVSKALGERGRSQ